MTTKSVPARFEEAFVAAAHEESLCIVGKLIADHEAGAVIKAKVDDVVHYSAKTISRVLKSFEVTVSSDAINKHRNNDCRCLPKGTKK